MPQVDLVSACAGGVGGCHNDRKVTCETLADDVPPASDQPDFPPESFFLSKEAELDWIDRNAFIHRKDSGKGSSLHSIHLNPSSNSGSQRYSLSVKTKPSIIGLPKTQKAAYAEAKHRRPANIRLFPKRSQSSSSSSGRKSAVQVSEPSSPKVSCIGRVRSRRDRSRRKNNRKKQPEPPISRSRSIKSQKNGFWSSFRSIFRSRGRKQPGDVQLESEQPPPAAAGALKKRGSLRRRDFPAAASSSSSASTPPSDPPNLGAVQRFSSGRRSDGWAADLEVDGAKSEPLDRGSIWLRRTGGGPLRQVRVERKKSVVVGPVSV